MEIRTKLYAVATASMNNKFKVDIIGICDSLNEAQIIMWLFVNETTNYPTYLKEDNWEKTDMSATYRNDNGEEIVKCIIKEF